jgi:hypothetical protein
MDAFDQTAIRHGDHSVFSLNAPVDGLSQQAPNNFPQVVIINSSSTAGSTPPAGATPPPRNSVANPQPSAAPTASPEPDEPSYHATEDWVDPGAWISIQKFGNSQHTTQSKPIKPFAVDPFAVGNLDETSVVEMPTIPKLDPISRAEHEKLKRCHGWTVTTVDQKPIENSDEAAIDGNEDEAQNVFYAEPSEVLFIDGAFGFDHIDLRCFDVNQATFQTDTIIVSTPDSEPITIRYSSIKYAVFSGEVIVDL